ncbi:MAG: xanthine dehydrogenase family protein subunit M [Rhodospirillales bacterium]|jgi:carbon-monoxide dehydrogenase medium subunit|nr:carbon monoxide dehydrogenase [Rhodospirillaceae bacterium]MDP6426910.1 xanthine dehydrogenase family protein subunit M [Rhodospirillales bacterium]MDP6645389.1 xanthine dehydrogenase family protein subunit M [Rhodospirillales bacterium]|tara:strand:+ start:1575 stop:2429 length:855 start_codon:yes stop_codon:yes gene_type:complete
MIIHKPTTLEEAARLLAADDDAQCIAGGATLVAMMNSGVVEPRTLISLGGIDGLNAITGATDRTVTIGATAKHSTVAAHDAFTGAQSIVGLAAGKIAHPPIRNMGTIGGSLAVADPATDYPTALLAAGAAFDVVGPDGSRTIAVDDFFTGFLSTALATGELIRSVELPAGPENAVAVYDKISKIDGDIAILSVAVVMVMADGRCSYLRIAVGGCGPTPFRSPQAEEELIGSELSGTDLDIAADLTVAASDPMNDVRATADYRRRVLPGVVRRALGFARQLTEDE